MLRTLRRTGLLACAALGLTALLGGCVVYPAYPGYSAYGAYPANPGDGYFSGSGGARGYGWYR